MKLFKNKEIRAWLIAILVVCLLFTIGAFIWNIYFGLFTLLLCVTLLVIYMIMLRQKYKKISKLSTELNKIIHGDYKLTISEFDEGELGLLQSEIYKLTVMLREQQSSLEKDKKFLENMIADISHQVKTPLTTINLLISKLSKKDLTDVDKAKVLSDLYELIYQIEWLIETLLKMSKLDAKTTSFKKESIEYDKLIKIATSALLVPIEIRNQTISIHAEGSFYGDILWTAEAIRNIVKNSMEHNKEFGNIKVIATENELYSQITIEDEGQGIKEEDLPYIFDRFYKGKKDTSKGFGIGLALARMIVINQNGTIKVENKPTSGAKFTIKFYKQII